MKMSSRIPVFLFFIFAMCPLLQGEEGGEAVIPENRSMQQYQLQRFHDQVSWINAVARDTKNFDIDLMFVGDSITHRWEKAGKDVWAKYYGNRRAFNFGTGSDRTSHVIWRLQNAPMDKIRPKMVVVMIGTNNRTKPADTVLGIKKIVGILKDYYPAAKILLLEVFPKGEKPDSGGRRTVNAINEGLRKEYANSDQVILKDLSGIVLEKDGTLPKSIMTDFLHPEAEGYRRWAEAIEPEIEKVLGPIPADPPEAVGTSRIIERFNQKNELLKKGNVDILMIGDSITHYWESNGQKIWDDLFAKNKAINLGTGWDRTENVIWRLQHYDFSKIHPKAAFLLIGVNNNRTSTPENIAKGNKKICEILHEKFPTMKIYVQKVFPWGSADLAGKNPVRNAINSEIAKAVKELDYVVLLDLEKCFLYKDGKLNTKVMKKDLVHLEEAGYQNWSKAIQPYVNLAP